jgi:DNA-binding MarR family transcriptional regulator
MTDEVGRPTRRRRNSVLAALELFRTLDLPRGFNAMILFLYTCENEGANVSEIAQVANMDVPGAARLIKVMAGLVPDEPVAPDKVVFELRSSTQDRRVRFVHLTDQGRRVRDAVESLISEAAPISTERSASDVQGDRRIAGART